MLAELKDILILKINYHNHQPVKDTVWFLEEVQELLATELTEG